MLKFEKIKIYDPTNKICTRKLMLVSIKLNCAVNILNTILNNFNTDFIASNLESIINNIEDLIIEKNSIIKHLITHSTTIAEDSIISCNLCIFTDNMIMISCEYDEKERNI